MKPKIMIGAPVRNRAWILPRHIRSVQDQTDVQFQTCYIVNDCVDDTKEILRRNHFNIIVKDLQDKKTYGHIRGQYSYDNLATLRNKLLDEFLKSDCTHLLSIDTDIIIPRGSVKQLLDADKDIISMIIRNHPTMRAHNIMRDGRHIQEDISEGVIPVDVTGAVYLIKREVIEAGVRYGYHRQGEDIGFCNEAKEKGFGIFCDTRLQPIHAYSETVSLKAELVNRSGRTSGDTKNLNGVDDSLIMPQSRNEKIKSDTDHFQEDITIIYPPTVNWYLLHQRPQQLLKSFAKFKNVRSIFVSKKGYEKIPNGGIMQLQKDLFVVEEGQDYNFLVRGKKVLWFSYPPQYTLADDSCDVVVFDAIDNPIGEFKGWQKDLKKATSVSDAIANTAKVMYDQHKNLDKPVFMCSNGVVLEDFNHILYQKPDKPYDFPKTTRPVVGFYGSLSSWVDTKLILKIAEKYDVVMIGRSIYGDLKMNHPNIHTLDHKDYTKLPNYLAHFDVAMIPFKLTEMIDGCDPVKFYEYLAGGKPIISTQLKELEKHSDVIYFVDENNVHQQIHKAIMENNKKKEDERVNVARENTWDKKASQALKVINSIIEEKDRKEMLNLFERIRPESEDQMVFLYPPTIEWDYKCFQRPHQLFKELAKQGHKAVFMNREEFKNKSNKFEGIIEEIQDNLFIVHEDFYHLIPNDMKNVVLYNSYPPTMHDKEKTNAKAVLFDYMDESADEFVQYQEENVKAMKEADITIVTSQRLYDIAGKFSNNFHMARNGADVSHFLSITKEEAIKRHPDVVLKIPKGKPIVGFYGALQSWIDFDVIRALALLRPDYNIVIVAPDYTGRADKYFYGIDNVHLLGHIHYSKLNCVSPFFDVGIIPFQVREMTKSSNPIKMYEYLASGLPVVSTKLPEAELYSDVVYVAEDTEDFIQKVDKAIEERDNERLIVKRQVVAMKNTWGDRAKVIIDECRRFLNEVDGNDVSKERGE